MREYMMIFIGGGLGATLRYFSSRCLFISKFAQHHTWLPIMLINVLGSFLIGVLYVVLVKHFAVSVYWRGLLMVGLLGGFTTFSSFSLDTLLAIENGHFIGAVFNIIFSVGGSICLCALGIILTKQVLNLIG